MLEVFSILEWLQSKSMLYQDKARIAWVNDFEWVSTQHYFLASARKSYTKVKEHLQNTQAMIESDKEFWE